MGAGASTLLPKLIDQQQAKAVANDRLDEAAFDAATVDGRVSRAVLMEISTWLQAIRDGAKKLDLTGKRIGDVGARALAASLEKNMLEHRLRLEKNMLELRDELRRQTEELKALLKKFQAVRARFARDRAFRVAMRFCRRGFAVLATACPFFRLLDLSIELDALRGASDHADLLLELLRSGTAADQPDPLLQQDR